MAHHALRHTMMPAKTSRAGKIFRLKVNFMSLPHPNAMRQAIAAPVAN
jgi:hypothetical protein